MSRHRIRVERGLYRDGSTFYACATPAGSRTARWKSLGEVGVMQARRLRIAGLVGHGDMEHPPAAGECSAKYPPIMSREPPRARHLHSAAQDDRE